MAEQLEPVPSVRVHQDGDRESAAVLFDLTPERICKQRSCDCELQAKVYCVPEDVGRAGLLV